MARVISAATCSRRMRYPAIGQGKLLGVDTPRVLGSPSRFISTKRAAFHILLMKWR